jgi:PTH1 family peptidyl-tRNA hydrolase
MRLLVGLGNPGPEYVKTRHNAGFWCVDQIAEAQGASWRSFKGGSLAEYGSGQEKALLFKPLSFMNRSGEPVRRLMDYFEIQPEDICVAADDVYIAPGSVRLRRGGGDGGHNGLRSLLAQLPEAGFLRARIGVGLYEQDPERRAQQPPLDAYVLEPLPSHEHKQALEAIDRLGPLLVEWLRTGILEDQTFHI